MRYQKLYIFIIIAGFFIASSGGRNDNRAGAPGDSGTCASCHSGSATNSGSVNLIGLPTEFEPGQTYDFQLQVSEPEAAGPLDAAGFQIVATNSINNFMVGSFTVIDANTRVNPFGRLVQTAPLNYTGTTATWDVRYTAPNNPAIYQDINFFYVGNSVDLNGNTGGDVVYFNSTIVTLPVEWESFTGKALNEGNYLSWETSSEMNNEVFVVEKSIDGRIYKEIGEIQGSGYSSETQGYEFLDENVNNEISYYRIKQIDFNGKFEYSEVVLIERSRKETTVEIYPSRVMSDLYIDSNEDLTLRIINSSGVVINEFGNQPIINMSNYNSGIYFVQCLGKHGELIQVKKIIKI